MATDVMQIVENLLRFYDFNNKTIVSVGAGGGQFVEYGRTAKAVIAIDNDSHALDMLKVILEKKGLSGKFDLINGDFCMVDEKGDVVLFEFCLHEMENPTEALLHAQKLAASILITDHWPSSEWAFIVDEKEKAEKSWAAIHQLNPKKVECFNAFQFFNDYDELYLKVKVQGDKTIERIEKYRGTENIVIPMSYGFALL